MHDREIRPEYILPYEEGKDYQVYAASIVMRTDKRGHVRELLNSMLTYWCNQASTFTISKVFAYADSDEGWNMIKHLFFAPRYDIGPKAFELDLNQINPSKLVTAFQDCVRSQMQKSNIVPKIDM